MVNTISPGSGSQFLNIAGAATTVVCSRAARLARVVINKKVASGVITIYNNATAASGTKLATITNPGTLLDSHDVFEYDAFMSDGIVVVTTAADDITVIFD